MRKFLVPLLLVVFIFMSENATAWHSNYFTRDQLQALHNNYRPGFKNWIIALFSHEQPQHIVNVVKKILSRRSAEDILTLFDITRAIRNPHKRLVYLCYGAQLENNVPDEEQWCELLRFINDPSLSVNKLMKTFIIVNKIGLQKLFTSDMDGKDKFDVMMALLRNPRPLNELPTYVDMLVDHAPKLLDEITDGVEQNLIISALAASNRPLADVEPMIDVLEKHARRLQTEGMTGFDVAYMMAALIRNKRSPEDTARFVEGLVNRQRDLHMENMDAYAKAVLSVAFLDSTLCATEIDEYVDALKSESWKLYIDQMNEFHQVAIMRLLLQHVASPDNMEQFVFDVLAEMNNTDKIDITDPIAFLKEVAKIMKDLSDE